MEKTMACLECGKEVKCLDLQGKRFMDKHECGFEQIARKTVPVAEVKPSVPKSKPSYVPKSLVEVGSGNNLYKRALNMSMKEYCEQCMNENMNTKEIIEKATKDMKESGYPFDEHKLIVSIYNCVYQINKQIKSKVVDKSAFQPNVVVEDERELKELNAL